MIETDRREEFKDVIWRQENCKAFAFYSDINEGKSAKLVYMFETPEECAAVIEDHNLKVNDKTAKWLLGEGE